jgi:hypothetical protein
LTKAFDCINHEILLAKLHFCGIWGVAEDRRLKENHLMQLKTFSHTGEHWNMEFPKGLFLGLPLTINSLAEPVLFADDTSVIISNRNFEDFSTVSNLVVSHMIEWFTANKLVLNLDKTNTMKFIMNNSPCCALHIGYKEKYIEKMVKTKFLGLHIDNHLNWKNHIDQMIPKWSMLCS